MKKILFAITAALAAISVFADGAAARQKFVDDNAAPFRKAALVAAEVAPSANDFLRAAGTAEWKIALPLKDDDRVRFLDAVFTDGKFVKGTLRTFGLPDEAVDAKRFAALRENYPMAARNMASEGNALAFYPALNCPLRIKTKNHAETIRHDATGHLLGSFFVGLDKRLGVNARAMHYEIAFKGPDGFKVVYGNNSVSEKQALPAMLAAMEAKWPERKGKISTRDIMNLYYLGAVTFRGVNTTPPAPNAKK